MAMSLCHDSPKDWIPVGGVGKGRSRRALEFCGALGRWQRLRTRLVLDLQEEAVQEATTTRRKDWKAMGIVIEAGSGEGDHPEGLTHCDLR